MLFNFWIPSWLTRPRKDGRYLCTTTAGYVLDLYYIIRDGEGKWIDIRRKNVFDGYKVYKSGREPLEYNRVFEDSLCERIDILAWKKLPRAYRSWSRKKGAGKEDE